jgi:peptidoglycan L-alanyl-D-glutamate endopeptidase CwlK
VLEGLRTEERQAELVASGASQTMNSRHLTGHAVDLAPIDPSTNEITWEWDYYYILEPHIKEMAEALYININWGGDWTSFKDGPHWELNWDDYPA